MSHIKKRPIQESNNDSKVNKKPKLDITKKSANTSITDNNRTFNKKPFNGKNFTGNSAAPVAGNKFQNNNKFGNKNFTNNVKNSYDNKNGNARGGGGGDRVKREEGRDGGGGKPTDGTTAPEKTDWTKYKRDKKELKLKRKRTKDIFEITIEGKKIYEELKRKETKNKDVLSAKLHLLFKADNIYEKLVTAHDTARIVQCLLKHSSPEIRQEISEKLLQHIVIMSKSKYAQFCVNRMVKYGSPDIKDKIIQAMCGNIIGMLNTKCSSNIIDTIYVSWASSQQKTNMRQEFYGDLYKLSKDSSVKCIADTYKNTEHMKQAVHNAVKANLLRIANKKLFDNSLVHAVLYEFIMVCSEADRTEIITEYAPFIPSLASTKDGTRSAIICFIHSIVKDRRAIVKNLREHLIKLCTHEHGHLLIMAIVNAMDDTKGIKKAIFDSIISKIEIVVGNEWGRKVIQWFVTPDDTTLFHPALIKYVEESLVCSKKDKLIRRTEILDSIEEQLAMAITNNATFWLRGGHTGITTAAIIKSMKVSKNLQMVYNSLADCICNVEWKVSEQELNVHDDEESNDATKKIAIATATPPATNNTLETPATTSTTEIDEQKVKIKKIRKSPYPTKRESVPSDKNALTILGIEHAGLHIVLKKLIKLDKERFANELPTLSGAIVERLTNETLNIWLPLNRPSFILLNMLENVPVTQDAYKNLTVILKSNNALLKKQQHVAAKLLIKKLNE